MPIVAVVNGIKIAFYHDEHPPPHFHANFAEHRAVLLIETLEIIRGELPKAKQREVVAWAAVRKSKLLDAWGKCRSDVDPGKIE